MMFFRSVANRGIVLLMGGPGSGKGELAKRLTAFHHVSTGELLREISSNANHPLSKRFERCMQRGELLADDEILAVLSLHPALQQTKPVLLDGFPRTFKQWELFHQRYGYPAAAIDVSVNEQTMRYRLAGRGRADDNQAVIDRRIKDYLQKTKPMSDELRQRIPNTLVIKADDLSPDEVSSVAREFLQQRLFSSDAYLSSNAPMKP